MNHRQMIPMLFLSAGLFAGVAAAPAQIEHVSPKVRVAPDDLTDAERRVSELYQRVLPAVVSITTEGVTLTDEGPRRVAGLGSGVLISPDCHVLTAAHVVDGAKRILVRTQDGVEREAVHVFSEDSADLALLRLVEPDDHLPHAELGDSDRLAVGQTVYAIGSPYGLENTLTVGRISAFREFGRLYDGMILAEFIQTDAAINSGNSGGPLFDSAGRVIGIASRIYTVSGGSQGLGFAVTINTATQLLALEERTWLGFDAIYLDGNTMRDLFHQDLDGGLLVQDVVTGSPAERAGLRAGTLPATIAGEEILLGGDLIVGVGHQEACHESCLVDAYRKISESPEVSLIVLRGGVRTTLEVDAREARRIAPASRAGKRSIRWPPRTRTAG